jgi:hypothetical protein
VWKKLLVVVMVIGLLPLSSAATAQDKRVVVWHALSADDTDVLIRAAEAFSEETGVPVEFRYVQPPLLYETVAAGRADGPDVIIADNSIMEPLLASDQIAPIRNRETFFLADLLDNLPPLIEERCGDDPIGSCLWPRVSPILPVPPPDQDVAERTADWLCESSPWLPFCRGGGLAGLPLSWGFNVYLLNVSWTAQQGLEPPTDAEGVLEFRSQFGLDFVEARPDDIPTASDADFPPVAVIASALMVEDPNGVMRSMGSFFEAGYTVVLDLHVDAAYISAASPNPDLAGEFITFLRDDAETRLGLMESSQRLPAINADVLVSRIDRPDGLTTLQAVVTLAAYAMLAY